MSENDNPLAQLLTAGFELIPDEEKGKIRRSLYWFDPNVALEVDRIRLGDESSRKSQ